MSEWTHPGAPIPDVADPMKEGVGAAAWAKDRTNRCDLTVHGEPKIQPMSILGDEWHVDSNDRDPRGMSVTANDGRVAGTVTDIWVDRSEPQIRYLQVAVAGATGPVLMPMGFCRLTADGIAVKALPSTLFAQIPVPVATDRVTLLEEDRIMAFFAGGYRYATPGGLEPLA